MLKTDPSDNKFQNSDEKELKDEGNTEVQNLDKTNQLCAKCGQHFTSLIDLVHHFFKLHKKPGEDFDCPMCPKIISLKYPTSKASVMEHMRNTHLKETKKCPVCKQIFKLSHYKKHRRQVHGINLKRPDENLTPVPNPDGKYECLACKKVLLTKGSFFSHRSANCPMNGKKKIEEPQTCTDCGKVVSSKVMLKLFKIQYI